MLCGFADLSLFEEQNFLFDIHRLELIYPESVQTLCEAEFFR